MSAVNIAFYGLVDSEYPDVVRYIGVTYSERLRRMSHESVSWAKKSTSLVDVWKAAVVAAGRRVEFVVIDRAVAERQKRWPHLPEWVFAREVAAIYAAQESGGRLLNREIVKELRQSHGVEYIEHQMYLRTARAAIFGASLKDLSIMKKMEDENPVVFNILKYGELHEPIEQAIVNRVQYWERRGRCGARKETRSVTDA